MEADENDVFDDSVDPYDREVDFDYDDGIADLPPDEMDQADEDEWDNDWEDDPPPQSPTNSDSSSIEEMDDYDEIDD